MDSCKNKFVLYKKIPFIKLKNSCDSYHHKLFCDLCNIHKGSFVGSGGYNSTFTINTDNCENKDCKKIKKHSGILRMTHKYLDQEEIENEKLGLYLQSLFSTSKNKGGFGCSKYICKVYDFGEYEVENKFLANQVFNCRNDKNNNCVPLNFDFEKGIYGVLENIPGGELFDRLVEKVDNNNSYNEREVANIIGQLLTGLNCIHSRGYVHLDIKLENILLKEKNIDTDIKIIDFGFVQKIPKDKGYINPEMFGRAGTPTYKSPEVNFSNKCNQKADIWAVGIVCIALLLERTNYQDISREKNTSKETLIPEKFFEKYKQNFEKLPCGDSASSECIDFLKKILVWEPESRMNASEALKHNWIKKNFFKKSIKRGGGMNKKTLKKKI